MGALVFEPCTGPSSDLDDAVELAALAAHAQAVWDDRIEAVLPQLVRAGGPSGGARPKALVGLRADGGAGFRYGEGELPDSRRQNRRERRAAKEGVATNRSLLLANED
jgi:serine/threonine-protein kinase HipA